MHPSEAKLAAYLRSVEETLRALDPTALQTLVDWIIETQASGGTIFTCGNGGSASTASHMAGDFIYGVSNQTGKPFRTFCLSDNQVGLLAVANDSAYADVFVEPLQKFLTKKDLLIALSGSGNSKNVIKAVEYAKYVGARTVGLSGYDGGKLKPLADLSLHAPIHDMEVSEDVHLIMHHCIKQAVIERIRQQRP